MIGTHNSITAATPVNKWMRLFKPFYKCQVLSIEELLAIGIRCFDFRIKFVDDEPMFCHGKAIFGRDVYNTLKMLNHYKTYIRIILDDDDVKVSTFYKFCLRLENTYRRTKFFGGFRKSDWKHIYRFEYMPTIDQRVGSMKSWWGKIFPMLWAITNTEAEMLKPVTTEVCLYDCIVASDKEYIAKNK